MKKGLTIREYTTQDKKILKKLMDDFCEFFRPINKFKSEIENPYASVHQLNRLLKRVREHEGVIYVAEKEGKIIGFIGSYLAKQPFEDSLTDIPMKLGHIKALYIDKNYRGIGVGSYLLSKAENYFKQKRCTHSTLSVFGPNKKAHLFYKNNGYQDRYIEMIKQL